MIERSPFYIMVFNEDGTLYYSNYAFREEWKLDEEDLDFIQNKYNIFKDKQLEAQGLLPKFQKGFKEKISSVSPFKYTVKNSEGGEHDHWFDATVYPIDFNDGKAGRIMVSFYELTKLKEAEKSKRQFETRMQVAVDGGDLGTWDWDLPSGKLTYNNRWAEMLGYSLNEVYEITWEGLLHQDDRDEARSRLNDHLKNKTDRYEAEYRLKARDGTWKWILDRGKVVEKDASGKAIRMSGTHSDITQIKVNEALVRENEEMFRMLSENAPIGIVILQNGKIVYANKHMVYVMGAKSYQALLGKKVTDFIPSHRLELFSERAKQVLEEKKEVPLVESDLIRLNGEQFSAEIVSIPVTFKGEPAMQSLIQDISERKKIEKSLTRNREMLSQLFNNAPMGIVMLNIKFEVEQVNNGFELIFGYNEEELRGKSLSEFIIPQGLKEEAEILNKSALEGKIEFFESVRVNKKGESVPVLIYALPVLHGSEKIGIYGIYVDISKRITAEEELRVRNLELDNFVYKVSHDLRAPLASILGLINLTKLDKGKSKKDDYTNLIESQVQRLDDFIHDILSHSKNLKMSVVVEQIDFRELVEQCFNDLGYLTNADSIIKSVSIDQEEFYSDRWRIGEIFRNLIGNAIKYHNPAKKDKKVMVEVKAWQDKIRISVADNGMGIPESRLPQIFDMFYRGTENSDGSGIGLYIVQKAVEKLHGTIEVESEVIKGTTFIIIIPNLKGQLSD